jgi:hypothetical protein
MNCIVDDNHAGAESRAGPPCARLGDFALVLSDPRRLRQLIIKFAGFVLLDPEQDQVAKFTERAARQVRRRDFANPSKNMVSGWIAYLIVVTLAQGDPV